MRKYLYSILLVGLLLFLGMSLNAQIPDGYYDSASDLSGEALKTALHNIIKGHKEYPYSSSSTDTWDILKETDKDPENPDNVILFYSGWSVNGEQEYNNEKGWSREHVWPKYHGGFDTGYGVGTDAHHLRPCDITVNNKRGNLDFDNGGEIYVDGDGTTECKYDNDSWEPRDAVKGDVARMLFYMATRYEGESGELDLELADEVNTSNLTETNKGFVGKLSTLLEWNTQDPIDSFEINRNEVVFSYQQNRNPFIDHPEFIEKIWGEQNAVSNLLGDGVVNIYPNPANNMVNIDISDGTNGELSVFNSSGQLIIEKEISDNFSINTNNYDAGIYLIRFISSTNKVYNFKQVVLK